MMLIDRLLSGSVQSALPAIDHVNQVIANRARPVVILNSATDINTAGGNLQTDSIDPTPEKTLQTRQTPWLTNTGIKNLLLELMVVEPQHINL